MARFDQFREVWVVAFHTDRQLGNRPIPWSMIAAEVRTGRTVRASRDELLAQREPPFSLGPDVLHVGYGVSEDLQCHQALGWKSPERILDLYAEFRCHTSGLTVACGRNLLGAMTYFGLDGTSTNSPDQRVAATARLLNAMAGTIDVSRALLRGRYMAAVARMEWEGTPIDVKTWKVLRTNWNRIQDELITRIDRNYGVYDGHRFKLSRFEDWLLRRNIPWPGLDAGWIELDDDTFREMAKAFPEISPLRELRHALTQLKIAELAVGSDGRNRCPLRPFESITGRNQPSSSEYVFGPSVWLRGLIKPPPGRALAYIDYAQQEFGIAAALSSDRRMQAAYTSGDPYLEFAKQAGAVPLEGTRLTHAHQRELFKTCALGVQYGMGSRSLADRIGQPEIKARDLIQNHRTLYGTFWDWLEAAVDHAQLCLHLSTVFGWRVHVGCDANSRSLANFPMQANGAEILRLACCMATERGICVCAPVHDALLIEASVDDIDAAVAKTQKIMEEASRIVLNDFPLRTDVKLIRSPERYMDPRGERFWNEVMSILEAQVPT